MITEQECKICKRRLPIDKFWKRAGSKSGYQSSCKECIGIRRSEANREKRIKQGLIVNFPTLAGRKLLEDGKKYCPTCKQILDLSSFSTMKKGSGVASHCKECSKLWGKKLKDDHPETKKKRHENYEKQKERWIRDGLRKSFGLTYEQYKSILKFQNDKCAICGKTQKENRRLLSVDHDHKTDKIRGILCSRCNLGIGHFFDNVEYFENAVKYLKSPPHELWKETEA